MSEITYLKKLKEHVEKWERLNSLIFHAYENKLRVNIKRNTIPYNNVLISKIEDSYLFCLTDRKENPRLVPDVSAFYYDITDIEIISKESNKEVK